MVAADIRELAEDAERQRNEETYFDVEMYDPAPKPKIDVAKTAAHLREVLKDRRRNNLTTADDLPRLSSNLILEENSDRYRMRMTLGPDVAGWLVTGLRIGVDAEIPVAYALDANISNNDRLRCMYGPTLNALVAKLRQTVFSLLSHENLGMHEIRASADYVGEDLVFDLAIDPLTSRMLRSFFAMNAQSAKDTMPFGAHDMLWGPVIREVAWLGNGATELDLERRDEVAAKKGLYNFEDLAPPNAPPHEITEQTTTTTGQQGKRWSVRIAPKGEAEEDEEEDC